MELRMIDFDTLLNLYETHRKLYYNMLSDYEKLLNDYEHLLEKTHENFCTGLRNELEARSGVVGGAEGSKD